jgi:hypothetical protein
VANCALPCAPFAGGSAVAAAWQRKSSADTTEEAIVCRSLWLPPAASSSSAMSSSLGQTLQQDWEQRETIRKLTSYLSRMTMFLNTFGAFPAWLILIDMVQIKRRASNSASWTNASLQWNGAWSFWKLG